MRDQLQRDQYVLSWPWVARRSPPVRRRSRGAAAASLAAFALAALFASPAQAQPDPSGIDFVTIGAPGNAAWQGGGISNGKGAVAYEYRIGRLEVTTSQWAEFFNAALDRPANDRLPHVVAPSIWGATGTTPQSPGGRRWNVPAGNEMRPVSGLTWRTAAMYANWLHNEKSTDRSAFMNGAYDVSTFGYFSDGGGFTDQLTRSPGARYWIPSIDEWMKAAHYDPARPNDDGTLGGWWQYSNGSDTPFRYGPPGVRVRTDDRLGPDPNGELATANAGWNSLIFPGYNPFTVPLGAYPTATTPWGLLDVAGGTAEWTEESLGLVFEPFPRDRVYEGSARDTAANRNGDRVDVYGGSDFPSYPDPSFGLRIAAVIPAPSGFSVVLSVGIIALVRRRRPVPSRTERSSVL
jgi:sulfatase modifying factor 1